MQRFRGYSLVILIIVAIVAGCTSYQPQPLTSRSTAEKLAPPDMAVIRIRAEKIQHPILHAVEFDERDGLSPDEAAILAVLINPHLRVLRDRRAIAQAQLLQASLLPNPHLSYDMNFPLGGDTSGTVNGFGLGLDWDVTSALIRAAKLDAARYNTAAIDLEIAWQEWQVAEAAKLHVYRLIIAQKRVFLAKQIADETRNSCNVISQAVQLGEKTSLDLAQVQQLQRQAELDAMTAAHEKQSEELALNKVLGLPSGQSIRLTRDCRLPLQQKAPSLAEALAGLEKRRLDLVALGQAYQSQEAKVRAAVKSQFPRITFGLSSDKDIENVYTSGFGFHIDLPFFNHNQGTISRARATRSQLYDEYTARLFDAHSEIARLLSALVATRKQIDSIKQSLPKLKHFIQVLHKATDNGNADILSYYRSSENLYNTRLRLLELQRRYVDLEIALELATGRYMPTCQDKPRGQEHTCGTNHKPLL